MTIASEITRLCNAKSAMKTEIIAKGVSVADSVKLDQYACCIKAIPTGSNTKNIDLLVVGGGGGTRGMGGGGGGGFIENMNYELNSNRYDIVVGNGGTYHNQGGKSCFGTSVIAYGGGGGGSGYTYECPGGSGGSGGGGGLCCCSGGSACSGQGYSGGQATDCAGGGGGGAGGYGCPGKYVSSTGCYVGGDGGIGRSSCISGSLKWYSGGGGGGSKCGQDHYGNAGLNRVYQCAAYCGGGASGASSGAYVGYKGVVILRYKTDGSCGIHCATGGCIYTCGDYTIHCFTCNGTFCIVC